jgi:1-phosphofructokinase
VEPDGTVTKLNEVGPILSADEVSALERAVLDLAPRADWVVGSGSLPRGVPDGFYADLVRDARAAGVRVAIDTSGPAMATALEAGPDLIKPNHEELAEVVGRPLPTLGDVIKAARDLCDGGVGAVLVSLGGAGAVLVEGGRVHHGISPVDRVVSTVGAGDATLAGFLAGGGTGPKALIWALAYGAAAVSLPGSVMPRPENLHLDAVQVTDDPDPARPLEGTP